MGSPLRFVLLGVVQEREGEEGDEVIANEDQVILVDGGGVYELDCGCCDWEIEESTTCCDAEARYLFEEERSSD